MRIKVFLRKIGRIFLIQWSTIVQYRIDTVLWAVSEAAAPLVAMAVWYRVAQGSSGTFTSQDAVTYYVFVIFVYAITNAWNGFFVAQEILNGKIVQYLVQPVMPLWYHITDNIVEKALKLAIPLPIFMLVLIVFPSFFSSAIYEPLNIVLFAISLALAVVIHFTFDISLGMAAFWLEDALQLRGYSILLQQVTAGILIPYALLPATLVTVFSFLPFRYMVSAPIELLMGQVQGGAAVALLLAQVAWMAGLLIAARVLWVNGLRRYAVPGQ